MANLRVRVRNIDDDTLYTHKTISVGSKSIDTPTKAIPIRKMTSKDPLESTARGINEIYLEISAGDLTEARQSFQSPLKKKVRTALNKSKADEINIIFTKITSTKEISEENLQYLTDFLQSTSDFAAVPLMTSLLDKIKEDDRGTASRYFTTYMKNIREFVRLSMHLNEKPIMGTLPPLPWQFTNEIVDFYINNNIRAFCFDFNGRKVTAETQLSDMVTPLMREVAMEDMEEDIFLYSLNANRGRQKSGTNAAPAADFLTFGFGFDILGDKHIGGNLPPHLFKEISDSEEKFRMFHSSDYVYRKHTYDSLQDYLPHDTGLDSDRILNRPQDSSRLSKLLNSEQQSLEAQKLRPAIDEYRVLEHIQHKQGVQGDNLEHMLEAKSQYEGNKNQTSLDDLDHLF